MNDQYFILVPSARLSYFLLKLKVMHTSRSELIAAPFFWQGSSFSPCWFPNGTTDGWHGDCMWSWIHRIWKLLSIDTSPAPVTSALSHTQSLPVTLCLYFWQVPWVISCYTWLFLHANWQESACILVSSLKMLTFQRGVSVLLHSHTLPVMLHISSCLPLPLSETGQSLYSPF